MTIEDVNEFVVFDITETLPCMDFTQETEMSK